MCSMSVSWGAGVGTIKTHVKCEVTTQLLCVTENVAQVTSTMID